MSKKPPAPSSGLLHRPFAGLATGLAPLAPRAPLHPVPARAVVRLERKGRGGKEVTVVERLELPAAELERWLKELKQSLGCGGALDGRELLLQGDHRERLRAWLTDRGVAKVSVG